MLIGINIESTLNNLLLMLLLELKVKEVVLFVSSILMKINPLCILLILVILAMLSSGNPVEIQDNLIFSIEKLKMILELFIKAKNNKEASTSLTK